jgi:hypothetical protein
MKTKLLFGHAAAAADDDDDGLACRLVGRINRRVITLDEA